MIMLLGLLGFLDLYHVLSESYESYGDCQRLLGFLGLFETGHIPGIMAMLFAIYLLLQVKS